MVYARWLTPENWPETRETFFGSLPPGVKQIVPRLIQRKVRRDSQGQGLGRLNAQQIYARAIKDLQAVSDFLGEQTYMLGEQVSSVDAIAFAWLANLLYTPAQSPLKDFVRAQSNLVAYCERMNKEHRKRVA